MVRRIEFQDTDEGTRLFVLLFNVFTASARRLSGMEELRAGVEIMDLRDSVSERVDADTRKLRRGAGTQAAQVSEFAYNLLVDIVDGFAWPPGAARDALWLRERLRDVPRTEQEKQDG